MFIGNPLRYRPGRPDSPNVGTSDESAAAVAPKSLSEDTPETDYITSSIGELFGGGELTGRNQLRDVLEKAKSVDKLDILTSPIAAGARVRFRWRSYVLAIVV